MVAETFADTAEIERMGSIGCVVVSGAIVASRVPLLEVPLHAIKTIAFEKLCAAERATSLALGAE